MGDSVRGDRAPNARRSQEWRALGPRALGRAESRPIICILRFCINNN